MFNNSLFTIIPHHLDEELKDLSLPVSFSNLYAEATQKDPGRKQGGFVRMEFVKDEQDKSWKDIVIEKLPGLVESLQDNGYGASDIGIIVRNGAEGSIVLRSMIDYAYGCQDGVCKR